ncbi:hypothetical protein DCAR_0312982 [Daucus carota subsp. sativus]|uniref:Endonuclease/exonuclease/phosphatase domain-containing protein n=1 Tax=Daucus carota subsp. sativus TaxID=79200 RepID=A0AAF0WQV8_DAUCS|nr:hypothetical protein DCAR_0312982 [Daucus carota subsp. sativus]
MWKEKDQVEIRSYSKYHIDVKITTEDLYVWRLTGFYGEPVRAQRRTTWNLLRTLARDANLLWCVIGDLNNVMSPNDKKGGDVYPDWFIDGFNAVVQEAGLIDMGLTGNQFTWERNRGTQDWTEVRLDRALTTEDWLNKFPMAKPYNLEGAPSDHSALLLVPLVYNKSVRKHRFKFENAWLTEPMCT